MGHRELFYFGEFSLEIEERRLRHGARPVHLAPKAFDLLVALLRHSGRLVSKDELLACVWPDSFVEEGILTVHVSALRRALGADPTVNLYRNGRAFGLSIRRPCETRRRSRR